MGAHSIDMHNSSTTWGIKAVEDNSTYEATLFGDHAVRLVEAHDPTAAPFFMYLAFHNEHDPHQVTEPATTFIFIIRWFLMHIA